MKAIAMLSSLPTHARVLVDEAGSDNRWVAEFPTPQIALSALTVAGITQVNRRIVGWTFDDVVVAWGDRVSLDSLKGSGFVKVPKRSFVVRERSNGARVA